MSEKALWWISFADPDRPPGERFLGVCIVEATDLVGAVQLARRLGCNPGGEARGEALPEEYRAVIRDSQRGVLLDAASATRLNHEFKRHFGGQPS